MRNKKRKSKYVDGDEEFENQEIEAASKVYKPDFETQLRDEVLRSVYGITDIQDVEIADTANQIKKVVNPDEADEEEIAEIKRLAGIRPPEI